MGLSLHIFNNGECILLKAVISIPLLALNDLTGIWFPTTSNYWSPFYSLESYRMRKYCSVKTTWSLPACLSLSLCVYILVSLRIFLFFVDVNSFFEIFSSVFPSLSPHLAINIFNCFFNLMNGILFTQLQIEWLKHSFFITFNEFFRVSQRFFAQKASSPLLLLNRSHKFTHFQIFNDGGREVFP